MKKYVAVVMSLVLLMSVLTACDNTEKNKGQNEAVSSLENVQSDAAKEESSGESKPGQEKTGLQAKDLVQDIFTRTETLELEEDWSQDVDYHVPGILSDSQGAVAINAKIKEVCKDVMEPEEDYVNWWKVNYEANLNHIEEENKDILSILLVKQSVMDDYTVYYAYNLDVTEGKEMDQMALLETLGKIKSGEHGKGESFLQELRKAAVYEADKDMKNLFTSDYYKETEPSETEGMYAQYLLTRMRTLQQDNINLELPMFLDKEGEISVAVPIYVMAGAGVYSHILKPREESTAKDMDLEYENGLHIRYQDGRMTICLEYTDWTEKTFQSENLEFGREYEVHGICKDYVDGTVLRLQVDNYVVPVFVSDDGLVSYIDLYACAKAGYFCITEPVMGLVDVEAVTENNADSITAALEWTMLQRTDSFSRNVMELYDMEGLGTEVTYTTDAGTTFTENYYMGFDGERPEVFLYQSAVYDAQVYANSEGTCTYLGMNEEGMIFAFDVYDKEAGSVKRGAFLEHKQGQWDEQADEWKDWADYILLSGYDLFDSGLNQKIQLEVSVG